MTAWAIIATGATAGWMLNKPDTRLERRVQGLEVDVDMLRGDIDAIRKDASRESEQQFKEIVETLDEVNAVKKRLVNAGIK